MQKVTLGILAHVDSGKTTLSEGLLYASGALRKLGRVDHGDAFLDTDALERERGITIFFKQAMLFAGDKEFTLLDTPGHIDFSAEMERTLSVLDYAVLVISGSDGVQSHTRTLWRLLTRYEVPTFLFINKMDLAGADKDALLRQLTATLSAECVDFSLHARAGLSEGIPAQGLSRSRATRRRAAHVAQVTGGALRVKAPSPIAQNQDYNERPISCGFTSGVKFRARSKRRARAASPPSRALSHSYAGLGLGAEGGGIRPLLRQVLTHQLILPDGADAHSALIKLRELGRRRTRCCASSWTSATGVSTCSSRGRNSARNSAPPHRPLRPLRRSARAASFKGDHCQHRRGRGHFEPRWATTPRCICCSSPAPRGSGVQLASRLSDGRAGPQLQRLILTHLAERAHPGADGQR